MRKAAVAAGSSATERHERLVAVEILQSGINYLRVFRIHRSAFRIWEIPDSDTRLYT